MRSKSDLLYLDRQLIVNTKHNSHHSQYARTTNFGSNLTFRLCDRKLVAKTDKWNDSLTHRHSDLIYVKKAGKKGRGVYACNSIRKGTTIEKVPVVIFPVQEIYTDAVSTQLADYVFNWGNGEVAIALGYGSLYNHSYRPNASYLAKGRRTQVYVALRDIEPDEEITVNYNGNSTDSANLWFETVR